MGFQIIIGFKVNRLNSKDKKGVFANRSTLHSGGSVAMADSIAVTVAVTSDSSSEYGCGCGCGAFIGFSGNICTHQKI